MIHSYSHSPTLMNTYLQSHTRHPRLHIISTIYICRPTFIATYNISQCSFHIILLVHPMFITSWHPIYHLLFIIYYPWHQLDIGRHGPWAHSSPSGPRLRRGPSSNNFTMAYVTLISSLSYFSLLPSSFCILCILFILFYFSNLPIHYQLFSFTLGTFQGRISKRRILYVPWHDGRHHSWHSLYFYWVCKHPSAWGMRLYIKQIPPSLPPSPSLLPPFLFCFIFCYLLFTIHLLSI